MRSVQHGMAAKISYEYMVPKTREDPSHLWLQNLQIIARPFTPSRQAMHTTVKNWVRPSTFTCKHERKKYEQLHNERTSSFVTHLDAAFGVLARTEEKRAVDERIPIENRHPFFAKDTVHFGATLRCER
jgi:hypothetical protein